MLSNSIIKKRLIGSALVDYYGCNNNYNGRIKKIKIKLDDDQYITQPSKPKIGFYAKEGYIPEKKDDVAIKNEIQDLKDKGIIPDNISKEEEKIIKQIIKDIPFKPPDIPDAPAFIPVKELEEKIKNIPIQQVVNMNKKLKNGEKLDANDKVELGGLSFLDELKERKGVQLKKGIRKIKQLEIKKTPQDLLLAELQRKVKDPKLKKEIRELPKLEIEKPLHEKLMDEILNKAIKGGKQKIKKKVTFKPIKKTKRTMKPIKRGPIPATLYAEGFYGGCDDCGGTCGGFITKESEKYYSKESLKKSENALNIKLLRLKYGVND